MEYNLGKKEILFHLLWGVNTKICKKANEIHVIRNRLISCPLMRIKVGEAAIPTR
jgi:hypothetical protein